MGFSGDGHGRNEANGSSLIWWSDPECWLRIACDAFPEPCVDNCPEESVPIGFDTSLNCVLDADCALCSGALEKASCVYECDLFGDVEGSELLECKPWTGFGFNIRVGLESGLISRERSARISVWTLLLLKVVVLLPGLAL